MTLTPEARAYAAVAGAFKQTVAVSMTRPQWDELQAAIASAIREAAEPYEATLSIIDSALDGIPGESRAAKIAHLRKPKIAKD